MCECINCGTLNIEYWNMYRLLATFCNSLYHAHNTHMWPVNPKYQIPFTLSFLQFYLFFFSKFEILSSGGFSIFFWTLQNKHKFEKCTFETRENIIQSNFPFVKQTNPKTHFNILQRTLLVGHSNGGDDCFHSDWPQFECVFFF